MQDPYIMQNKIKEYHLHKDDYAKLHFEINDAQEYLVRNESHVFKAHRHSFFMFIWFKNEGSHFVDFEEIDHPANSLFLVNKNQIHYFCEHVSNEGILYHFDEIFISRGRKEYRQKITFQLFNETGLSYLILNDQTRNILELLTTLLLSEIKVNQYNQREMIFSHMQTLVLSVERLKYKQSGKSNKNDANQDLAMEFLKHIEANLDTVLTLAEYAAHLGISVKKLSTISNDYFLMAPSKFVAHRKLLEAKRLLSNVNLSIKEVAYGLGFSQPTYFTKYFKKYTGLTPKEFVKKIPS